MSRYAKARPDHLRFPRIDASVVQDLGGVEKRPAAVLLASWLAGGAAHEEKRVETPKGSVVVAPQHTWGSLLSVQEDVLAAVGERFSYGALRNAVKVLRSAGLVTDRYDPLPATRGKYGSVFALCDSLFGKPETPVNVSASFIHRYYGDPQDFRYATCVTGVLDTGRARRFFGDADAFIAKVAAGTVEPAFTNIGRWRKGDVMDPNAPVFVPWFTIDIDRNYLRTAWDDTHTIVERLADIGFDIDRTFISFSGRRGFHIQIGADQIGCPIFRDSDAAKLACDELSARLSHGIKIDPSVNAPSQLLRVTGSRHNKSGLFKVTWTMNDFQRLDFEYAMELARNPQPSPSLDVRLPAQIDMDLHDFFDEVAADTESRYQQLRERSGQDGGPGEVIRSLLNGVEEGQTWHVRHEGRNKAAFVLACWLVEEREVGDADIDAALRARGPFDALVVWNRRNSPPMPERELWSAYGSAHRRVAGTRPNPNRR